jgi:hypothetical protein
LQPADQETGQDQRHDSGAYEEPLARGAGAGSVDRRIGRRHGLPILNRFGDDRFRRRAADWHAAVWMADNNACEYGCRDGSHREAVTTTGPGHDGNIAVTNDWR